MLTKYFLINCVSILSLIVGLTKIARYFSYREKQLDSIYIKCL